MAIFNDYPEYSVRNLSAKTLNRAVESEKNCDLLGEFSARHEGFSVPTLRG
jgi:hypothetical protein